MPKKKINLISERLNAVCQAQGVKLPELATQIGIPYTTLYKYSTGATLPTYKLYEGLYNIGVNINWFISGEGGLMRGQSVTPALSSATSARSDSDVMEWLTEFSAGASDRELIWLDVEMENKFPQYAQFKRVKTG